MSFQKEILMNSPGIALPGNVVFIDSIPSWALLVNVFALAPFFLSFFKSEVFINRLRGWGKWYLLCSIFPRSVSESFF